MKNKKIILEARVGLSDWILGSAIFSAVIFAYFPVWRDLVLAWATNEEAMHGFLIVPAFIYSFYSNFKTFPSERIYSTWKGLYPVLLCLILYLFALISGIRTLASLTLVFLAASIIFLLLGRLFLRSMIFPLTFLTLMVPVPSQIQARMTLPLQLTVTKISVVLAGMTGIPVYREGNVIHIPKFTLQVVNACSGLRSIVALLAISLLVAYFGLRKLRPRLLLIVSAVPIALIVNTLRVYAIIVARHYFGLDLAIGLSHTLLGVGVFLASMMIIMVLREILLRWEASIR